MNTAIKKTEKTVEKDIENYQNKFDEKAVDNVMDVGAMDLEELETDFGMIEDERERKRQENQVSHNLVIF